MTSYYIEMTFNMGGPLNERMQAHLDDVAEAFAEITDVDGDVGVDIEAGRVDLCVTVSAEDRAKAVMKAFVAARTAVHTAGGLTAGWDGWLPKLLDADEYTTSVTLSSLTQRCPA